MSKANLLTYAFAEKIVSANPLACDGTVVEAQYGLIDYLASSFAGSRDSGVSKLISIIEEEGGKKTVPLIGNKLKASPFQAALINGFVGHVLDFDDVHSDVRGHPSTVILPTLISATDRDNISGKKLLAAYIIGVEVMARLGEAIGAEHYLCGWHNTATLGTIAAAAAAGYLKDFTIDQMAKVIGFAATQASGLRIQFGTETKPLHAGLAAQAAIKAVKFVEYEINGSTSALDGNLGFFEIYGEGSKFAESFLLENWGVTWKIVNPGLWFKIYPFCSAAHHAADAATKLFNKYKFNTDNIKKINIIFPPNGDAALIHRQPKTGEQGRFSVEYVVALALKGIPLSLSNFRNLDIPLDVRDLIQVIKRSYDDSITPASNSVPHGRFTIVQVITKDDKKYQERVDCPKGAPGNPLSLVELKQKLQHSVMCYELSEKLFEEIRGLTAADNLKSLLLLL